MRRWSRRTLYRASGCGIGWLWLVGCQAPQPPTLSGSAFLPAPGAAPSPQPLSVSAPPTDAARPGMLPTSAVEPVAAPQVVAAKPASLAEPAPPGVSSAGISPLVAPPATQPASDDASTTPPAPSYMTLGGIVAEVNGTPIYANNLLTPLNAELSAKSREMDVDSFRSFARGELQRQREVLIDDEAEFAAAELLLSDDDKKLAEQITIQDRKKLVTASGGSVELAKRKMETDGSAGAGGGGGGGGGGGDFDDAMRQQYRRIMQQVFYQRKVVPRIQVTAADMREFYDTHLDRLYSERSQAQFRVIKIDPARIGGANADAAARKRIADIRDRALRGEDFATLASTENQDDWLKSRAGDPGGWMQRDSYRIDAVDHAVWQIQPGTLTPIIASDGAYYLAKLEARKDGRTRPFDDPAVQDDVHNRLWEAQYAQLRGDVLSQLESEAVVRRTEAMLDPAMDMVMQEYARWHNAR